MSSLADVLTQIGQAAGLNPADLIAYAAEDTIGGRDRNDGGWWPAMSVHEAEGKVLYALVRALRPDTVVEVGVASGGTTTHLLTALEVNGSGHLYSYDIDPESGTKVPEQLRKRWTFTPGDALTIDLPDHADFIFEDGEHTYEFTRAMLTRLKTLVPRLLVSHDYFSHEVYPGFGVKQGFDEVLPGAFGVKPDDAFTGLGVWVNRGYEPFMMVRNLKLSVAPSDLKADPMLTMLTPDVIADAKNIASESLDEAIDPIPVPKPKRKAARR